MGRMEYPFDSCSEYDEKTENYLKQDDITQSILHTTRQSINWKEIHPSINIQNIQNKRNFKKNEKNDEKNDYLTPDSDSDMEMNSSTNKNDINLFYNGKTIHFDPFGMETYPILPFPYLPMKRIIPSIPHPIIKKYNHRSIYNCVRCGQMKKFHVCSFPENVRSVGTSMSSNTIPRDNVSRYYKCGRVLICKK